MYHGIIQHRDYITEYFATRSCRGSSTVRVGHGRIYRIVHETTRPSRCRSLDAAVADSARRSPVAPERLVARHGAAAARRTRRSVGRRRTRQARNVSADWRQRAARAVDARWSRQPRRRRWSSARSAIHRATCARRRSGWPSGGCESRTLRSVPPSSRSMTTRTGQCGVSWPRRSVNSRAASARPRSARHARATRRRPGVVDAALSGAAWQRASAARDLAPDRRTETTQVSRSDYNDGRDDRAWWTGSGDTAPVRDRGG